MTTSDQIGPSILDFPGTLISQYREQKPGLHQILTVLGLKGPFSLTSDDQLVQREAHWMGHIHRRQSPPVLPDNPVMGKNPIFKDWIAS
nr:hypothetical protein [Dechloromonas sp.]